jgi:hypothetical protein
VSNKTRFFTVVLGVTALAGLTYGVTRRGMPRRAVHSLGNQPLASTGSLASLGNVANTNGAGAELGAARADTVPTVSESDWETLTVHSTRASTPDALDIAMNLDGLFDAASSDGDALTVRPSDRVPPPTSGDDEEAPAADDLGRAWLTQATQAEHSLTQADLIPEIDDLAFSEETDTDELALDEIEADELEADEHEDFRITRA